MVFLADWEGKERSFTCGIFGVQHGPELTESKRANIKTLHALLCSSAGQLDLLVPEGHGLSTGKEAESTTFVAYWLDSKVYRTWAASDPVQEFWKTLSEDAGVWREVMTVPTSRYMFAANQNLRWGLASLTERLRASNDEGYWGVYRHRIGSTDDTFTSPYITAAKAAKRTEDTDKPLVINIPPLSPSSSDPIRRGHVRLNTIPNNMIWVREGQRQPNVANEELDLWLERVSPHARSWIEHLDSQREKNGVLSFSTHTGHEYSADEKKDRKSEGAETDQLAYFLDLAHFEASGRSFKGHVTLRKNMMEMYGPGGPVAGIGKAELYVELIILKSNEFDAEYVGCVEGTGLMFLENI